jgi:hypothetical protein
MQLTLHNVLHAHHSVDARLLHLVRPEVPARLASLVARMMAKEPGRRFQTPAELATALAPFFSKDAQIFTYPSFTVSGIAAPDADLNTAEIARPPMVAPADATLTPATLAEPSTNQPEPKWANMIADEETEDDRTRDAITASAHRPSPHWFRAVLFGLLVLELIAMIAVAAMSNGFLAFLLGLVLYFAFILLGGLILFGMANNQ